MDPQPQPPIEDSSWMRPLRAWSLNWATPHEVMPRLPLSLLLDGLPDTDRADVLLPELEEYPTATGAEPAAAFRDEGIAVLSEWGPNGKLLPIFRWRPHNASPDEREQKLEQIAPHWSGDDRVLVPRLAGKDLLSPLMLWWLLLFGLSIVARYEPELWIRELDVNTSRLAVPMEAALDVALEVLPEWILAELT
jgi:hypothetical protein